MGIKKSSGRIDIIRTKNEYIVRIVYRNKSASFPYECIEVVVPGGNRHDVGKSVNQKNILSNVYK